MSLMATTGLSEEQTQQNDLTELLERMRPDIVGYARRRVGPERAEEILSDVYLAALQAKQQGRSVSPGWLMTVSRNKTVDHWRRTEREGRLVEKLKAECPLFVSNIEAAPDRNEVIMTLQHLQSNHQTILIRHYVYGEPVGSMAEIDGVSYRAMESAMARARRAFRETYREERARVAVVEA